MHLKRGFNVVCLLLTGFSDPFSNITLIIVGFVHS